MRNILALLGAGLLAGCCLMHFHVPITEQTQTNARTFGSLGPVSYTHLTLPTN